MAEMQIGRITGLAEPQEFGQPDQSTVTFSVLATPTQARQLLGHGDNGAERFVPIDFGTWGGEHDGIYELLEVSVDADPNLDAAGLRQVSVTARAQNRGRQIANSVLLVRGDNRNRTAAVGVTGPLYRASVPSTATSLTSFNAGPAGFTVGSAVPTLGRNSVVRLTDGSQVLAAVAVSSTAAGGNVTLSGTQTVDGVSVSVNGTRVLVKNQTTPSQNGIYVRAAGAWTRATDADGGTELDRAIVHVTSGTANAATTWQQPASGITIGTTAQTWQRSPAWGLRESARGGPVSITYASPLANWYDGACTITQDGAVVTGTTPLTSPAPVMDNGLIKIDGDKLFMASGSPLAWKSQKSMSVSAIALDAGGTDTMSPTDPTIVTNTPEVCTLRYRLSGTYVAGTVDITMMKGSRTVTVALSVDKNAYGSLTVGAGTSGGFSVLTVPTAASGIGYTSAAAHLVYAASDDSDSNRWGLSYAGTIAEPIAAGFYFSATAKRAHVFGIHGVVGGGATLTGDEQLYGMDRAWFAMLAQQTSAGVL
jgi:hypothetical protein